MGIRRFRQEENAGSCHLGSQVTTGILMGVLIKILLALTRLLQIKAVCFRKMFVGSGDIRDFLGALQHP